MNPVDGALIISTSVYRLGDGLCLCAAFPNPNRAEVTAKASDHEERVFQHLRNQHLNGALQRYTFIEGDVACYYVLNDSSVCYLACAARGTRMEAVNAYLEDVRRDFYEMYSMHEVNNANRSYQFIRFDTRILKAIRRFEASGGSNPQVDALKKELQEVTSIMQQSLEDILGRGEKLNDLHSQSHKLRDQSAHYRKKTQQLSRMQLLRKYGPYAVASVTVFGIVWWKLGFSLLFFL